MTQPKQFVELDIPARLDCTYAEVSDENAIRRFCHRNRITLPGDIDIAVTEYEPGSFHVTVWEKPITDEDLPE